MRDDLLDAQAAVDWAVSDLPILQRKIDGWLHDAPYEFWEDTDSQPGKKLIRLRNVKLIPLLISAEAGIIIHSIRSSLDVLAVALAERNGASEPKDIYFPIWRDAATFNDPNDRTREKIKRLSAADCAVIENLKPYKGGNDLLFILHNLDLTRKHRRLLAAYPAPSMISVFPGSLQQGLQFIPFWPGFKENAIIAVTGTDAAKSNFDLTVEIRIAEPGPVSTKSVIAALNEFASLANSIIKLFDSP